MEFSIGRLYVKVGLRDWTPFNMGKASKRALAERILAEAGPGRNRKIARVKTLRLIAIDNGWYALFDFGLKAAKDWVEEVFADNGAGEIVI